MILPDFFFNQVATVRSTIDGSDATASLTETPSTVASSAPVCVQQDKPPEVIYDNEGRKSVATLALFFRPTDAPGATALRSLRMDDTVVITGYPNPIVLDGTPFDRSGQGVVFEASGKHYS